MKTQKHWKYGIAAIVAFSLLATIMLAPSAGIAQKAQTPNSSASKRATRHGATADNASQTLPVQLRELQEKVAKLEAALKQRHQGESAGSSDQTGHGGHGKRSGHGGASSQNKPMGKSRMKMGSGMKGGSMQGMGMMSGGKMGMGMMGGGKMGMGMMKRGMGMSMMGSNPAAGKMSMPSALPGFPGMSHIYHIGETGFFLDHPQHITLSSAQQTSLSQLKEKAMLADATFERNIGAGEQQLWVLTSSDSPDIAKIDAKVREIEKLRGERRIAFIRTVGGAANVLTDKQRQTLVGHLPPEHTAANASDDK